MANEFIVRKGLIVEGASGGTVVDIQGSQGQLFSVTDDLSGSIFAVADISGVPIFDVNSSGVSYFDGNVGIGTDSPQQKLHIKSTTSGSTGIIIENTNNAQSLDLDFWSNGGSAQGRIRYEEGSGAFAISPNVGDPNAMYINYSNNVGIGTTAPVNKIQTNYAPVAIASLTASAGTASTNWNRNAFLMGTGASVSNALAFGVSGTANDRKAWIQSGHPDSAANSLGIISLNPLGGNVGIGTTAPGANLDVAGTAPVIRITNTTDPLGNGTVGSFEFFTKDSSTGATRTVSSIVCDNNAGSSVPEGELVFKTSLGGAGSPVATEKMRIDATGAIKFNSYGAGYLQTDASGNITSGTVTTSDTLDDVTDNGNTTTNSITVGSIVSNGTGVASSPTVTINNSSSATFNHTAELITANLTTDETNALIIGQRADTKNAGYLGYLFSSAASNDNVLTFGHIGATNLMALTGDGKLGIGNVGPSQALHVTGSARVTGFYYDSSNSAGTAGQILSSTATGTDWIAAPSAGSTVYTPDVFEIKNSAITASQNRAAHMEQTLLITGSTGVTIATGQNVALTASESGVYEISYTIYLKTTHTARQVIGAYVERQASGGQPAMLDGSFSSVYMRIGGSNQGGEGTITNTFYAVIAASDVFKFRTGRADAASTAPVGVSIADPAWPGSSVKHTISFRKINAAS
jgi:hypothetical protein